MGGQWWLQSGIQRSLFLGPMAHLLRLAAFPVAYGLGGVFIGGTLNREMIAELGLARARIE